MAFTPNQTAFIKAARKQYKKNETALTFMNRADLQAIADKAGLKFPQWLTTNPSFKVDRGIYRVPEINEDPKPKATKAKSATGSVAKVSTDNAATDAMVAGADVNVGAPVADVAVKLTKGTSDFSNIPTVDPTFVQFGDFKAVLNILKSNIFYPVFISGLSGNGKTFMVEQACAKAQRDFFRVNITIETDEDDLLGGFRLVDGETVWFDGPVVKAMRAGGVLLLDEIDLASSKIMCLQPVMEGKGIFLKKINEWVIPAVGFTIIATANTKGKGDMTGNFSGTNVMNEAMLERFPITIEQDYPTAAVEKRILRKNFEQLQVEDDEYIDNLVSWADTIRKTYMKDAIDELITTRRLVHISKAYAIFGDRVEAIDRCIARFDDETKKAFKDLYTKVDASVGDDSDKKDDDAAEAKTGTDSNDCPF